MTTKLEKREENRFAVAGSFGRIYQEICVRIKAYEIAVENRDYYNLKNEIFKILYKYETEVADTLGEVYYD